MKFTFEELAAEAEREVRMRRYVYGRQHPIGGKLTPEQKRRVALMEQIAKHFRDLAQGERLI